MLDRIRIDHRAVALEQKRNIDGGSVGFFRDVKLKSVPEKPVGVEAVGDVAELSGVGVEVAYEVVVFERVVDREKRL